LPQAMTARVWFLEPRWRVVWFLTLAAALNFGDRSAMSAVLAAVRKDFGTSDVALGLIGSVFLWSYALGSPFAGNLGDRFSRTKLIVGSLFAWSAVTLLVGLANGYPMLLGLRVALGLSECLFLPAALALIASYHATETRARAMSWVQIGANAGMVIGGSTAGFFADHHGWRSGFLVLGGVGIGLALLSRTILPAKDGASDALGRRNDATVPRAKFSDAVKYVLRVPSYWALLCESMLSGLGMWVFFTWLPLYFRETYSMSLTEAGFAGTFMLQISVVLGVMAGGWISDRVSAHAPHRRMLLYGLFYLLGAPCLLLFLGQPSFVVVAVAISAFSFLRGLASSNDNPTQCEIVPAQFRATGVGVMNCVATAAGGCGVLLAGFLKREVGLAGIFAGISGCFFIAAIVLLIGWRFFMRRDIERARGNGA
jgi:predicted MFS family arabinose efflux permease